MRGKQTKPRHKDSNTFKFQSFTERISNIKIDVFHRVRHINEEDTESETYFYQALDKWSFLNCSKSFTDLQKEIKDIQTLPQILKQKDHVVSVLLKHLDAKNTLNLQPVLELVVALAKDLRQDFYSCYQQFHKRLLDLLEIHDPDVLEWTFHCLAYLFKFLWRYLITDLQNIFESLMPLLSSTRPDYINNFAAGSFAFVARKIKDQRRFLNLVLKLLKKFPDGIEGCGRLLYEVVKGVSGRFHSCADTTLAVYLEFFNEAGVTFRVFCQVITSTYRHIIRGIHPNHCELLWTSLQNALSKALSDSRSSHNEETINFILNIIKFGVENRSGSMVKDAESLINLLSKVIQPASDHKISSVDLSSQILSLLLLSPHVKLTQEFASKILLSGMSYLKGESLLKFIDNIMDYSGFDGLVLPHLLKYCSNNPIDVTLPLISKLILIRSPPSLTAHQLMDWQPYSLNFPSNGQNESESYGMLLLEELSSKCAGALVSNIDKITNCLLVLPHISKLDRGSILKILKEFLINLCLFLTNNCASCCSSCSVDLSDCLLISKTLMLLSQTIEAIIKIRSDCPSKLVSPDVFLEGVLKFAQSDEYLSAIRALDFYVTSDELNSVAAYSSKIKEKLWLNLMSPYHKVRLLSVHILYELEKGCESSNNLSLQILESCWRIELTPASMNEYREKLKFTQKLEVDCALARSTLPISVLQPPIALLLGQLFVNFKLIWKPVSKLLASVANSVSADLFWPIFYSQLSRISFLIRENSPPFKLDQIYTNDALSSLYSYLNDFDDRPDYINYRILLWNSMKDFSHLCEIKNRDVVSEVLTFIENEYFARNADLASTWNIKKTKHSDSSVEMDTTLAEDDSHDVDDTIDDLEDMDADDSSKDINDSEICNDDSNANDDGNIENGGENDEENTDDLLDNESSFLEMDDETEPETNYKWANRSLVSHLELLTKFNAPKSLSREGELHKYYLEFLSHKQASIQKAALDCLLTYKDKFLVPYRQELYNLIDDSQFRHEINRFRINSQSDFIKPEHRPQLIPIVLRIVYIKMYIGPSKGANSRFARRAAVIRFLGGCTIDELNSYFAMSFPLFINRVQDDAVQMVEDIMSSVDLEKIIPPRKLQSLVDLLRILVVHTGGLLDHSSLGRLIRLVMCHTACAVGALSQRQLINASYAKTLKVIRSRAIDIFIWLFDKFQDYPWSPNEIDAIFSIFIWHWIEKFHMVSVKGPTPLLKLFSVWSQNPRYFILLSHWKEINGKKISPISSLMDLWLSKTHKSVNNVITDIVERMLTLIESNESSSEIQLSYSPFYDAIKYPEKAFNNLNFGSKLMLRQAASVMEKLKQKLSEGSPIAGKELEILSRITEIVMLMEKSGESLSHCNDLSESLYSLLLPILLKRASSSEHITTTLLTSVRNLTMIVSSPGKHIKMLAPLFSKVSGSLPRKLLVDLIVNSHKRGGSDSELNYDIVEGINAYNVKWLDQPDFDKRLDSFKEIESLMNKNQISFDLGLIIIHTCYYFMTTEKDLSLKNSSVQCLRNLCPYLSKHFQDTNGRHLLVDKTILSLINQGIRNKQEEFVRNESISLLGIMVRECPDVHPVLQDLVILSNKEDIEKDFFENMQHLQHHRRLRAMVRLCEEVKGYEKAPRPRAMTQFVLPIISFYLCNEQYVSRPTVIDCAAQALKAICELLPWHQYLEVLKYYLEAMQKKNDFQKQLVRINIDILNAFHFDLSAANRDSGVVDEESNVEGENMDTEQNGLEEEGADLSLRLAKEDDEVITDVSKDNVNGVEGMEVDTEGDVNSTVMGAADKVSILPRSSACRVVKVIRDDLIKKLQRALSQRSPQDSCHRTNKKQSLEDSDQHDMIRIPLAIAIVKLLQKLPSQFLENNLSGVVMKVVSYLKSRVESVRRAARKTLQEIAISLGSTYLCPLVKEMIPLLTRGFHVHVLAFTVHSLLIALKPHFKLHHIDPAIPSIIEVCKMDLFGDCSEEKEVVRILGKVLEARSSKSFSSFNIMAQFISEKYLLDLILPLKEELSQTLSAKTVGKVGECLRQISLGLVDNQFISDESLLLFAYGTASESIPALLPQQEPQVDPKVKIWESRKTADCFIIPQEPKRQKCAEVKACSRTNSHLLVEFGLRLLYILLRRERLKDVKYLPLLDPVVQLLSDCLQSQHVKISTVAIQCLCWVLKYDLPSLRNYVDDLNKSLFSILHKYAASGLSKGDNFELVSVTFKAMGVLVREVKYCNLEPSQLRALLMYCEQDLEDYSRQATAFSLIKAVLTGRISSPELYNIMMKVATISVTASLDSVRVQARQVVHLYLMEYTLSHHKMNEFLSFYYDNLDYDLLHGRDSVLKMLQTIIDTFPEAKLEEESSAMFINLSARLVNDPSPECRKSVASVITSLLTKVNKNCKNKMIEITEIWLQQSKETTRRLAVQLIGLFVNIEKEEYSARLDKVLPSLVNQFICNNNQPGKFVLLNPPSDCDSMTDGETNNELMRDHLLFQTLQVLGKIITYIPEALTNSNYSDHWAAIIGYAHSLLCHPHEWVRLGSVQLLGLTLSTVEPQDLAYSISHPPEENSTYLVSSLFSTDPRSTLRSVTLDLLAQLTPDNELNNKFILQIMKLLVYIAEVLKELKPGSKKNSEEEDEEMQEDKDDAFSLIWLVRKIRRVINGEIVHAPHSTSVRTMCFNWIAAVAVKLDKLSVSSVGYHLLAPLARELSLGEESDPLRKVAKEASQYIRNKLGHDEYNRLLTLATSKMDIKRAKRKTERAQMVINDPVRAAKRKLYKQDRKKLLKKRKISLSKTNKYKRKGKDIDLDNY